MAESAIDYGQMLNALDHKADRDLRNAIQDMPKETKEYFSSLPLTSENYIDLTLPSSGTNFISPGNGWIVLARNSTDTTSRTNILGVLTNDSAEWLIRTDSGDAQASSWKSVYIPVKKGQVVRVEYNTNGTTKLFRFVYAEGEI